MNRDDKANYLIDSAPVGKTILFLVLPAILGSVVGQINLLLDVFFLNKVNYADVNLLQEGVAAAFPFSLLLLGFATLFGIGGSIYGSRILGEGDKLKARSVLTGTLLYSFILNIILVFILLLLLNPTFYMLGIAENKEALKYAWEYAGLMIIGSFSLVIAFIFAMFARSEGKAGLVLIAIVAQTLTNIFLNYLFVIPFEWGTFGASLATVLSQVLQVIIIGIYFFSPKSEFRFYSKFSKYFKLEDFKNIVFLGIPATLGIALLAISSFVLQFQAGFYSDDELIVAVGGLIKLLTMFTMIIQAAASGIQPVFSYAFGANDRRRFSSVSKSYLKISSIVGLVVGIMLILFPYTFSNLLGYQGQTAEYIKIGTYGLGLMLFILPASFLQQVLFQSLDRAGIALKIVVIRQFLIFLVVAVIMQQIFSEIGILLSQQVAVIIGAVFTLLFYKKTLERLEKESFKGND